MELNEIDRNERNKIEAVIKHHNARIVQKMVVVLGIVLAIAMLLAFGHYGGFSDGQRDAVQQCRDKGYVTLGNYDKEFIECKKTESGNPEGFWIRSVNW